MKQRIGIDVDGVLRDFCSSLVRAIKTYHPEYLKDDYDESMEGGIITDWHLENNFTCTKKDLQQIYWYEHADWIMGNGDPFEDNVDTLRQLMNTIPRSSREWVCVTSQKEHAYHHTLSWLGKHELNFDKVVFAKGRDKWRVEVDYLIDDSPANWRYWKQGRESDDDFILLDRPYNQKVKSTHRVSTLTEAEGIIL